MLRRNSAWSGTAKCSWRTARGGLSPVLQRCQKQRCCSTPAAPSQAPGTPNPAGFQGFPNPAVSSQTSPSLWSLGAVPVLRRELCQPHKEQTSSSAGTLTCVSAAGLTWLQLQGATAELCLHLEPLFLREPSTTATPLQVQVQKEFFLLLRKLWRNSNYPNLKPR